MQMTEHVAVRTAIGLGVFFDQTRTFACSSAPAYSFASALRMQLAAQVAVRTAIGLCVFFGQTRTLTCVQQCVSASVHGFRVHCLF